MREAGVAVLLHRRGGGGAGLPRHGGEIAAIRVEFTASGDDFQSNFSRFVTTECATSRRETASSISE
eukprot:1188176-Prorocentrum_minimum.AAC.5